MRVEVHMLRALELQLGQKVLLEVFEVVNRHQVTLIFDSPLLNLHKILLHRNIIMKWLNLLLVFAYKTAQEVTNKGKKRTNSLQS
jgi:hypothetical protein